MAALGCREETRLTQDVLPQFRGTGGTHQA